MTTQTDKPWDPGADVERLPTDAYGDVMFFPVVDGRVKPAKVGCLARTHQNQPVVVSYMFLFETFSF